MVKCLHLTEKQRGKEGSELCIPAYDVHFTENITKVSLKSLEFLWTNPAKVVNELFWSFLSNSV